MSLFGKFNMGLMAIPKPIPCHPEWTLMGRNIKGLKIVHRVCCNLFFTALNLEKLKTRLTKGINHI